MMSKLQMRESDPVEDFRKIIEGAGLEVIAHEGDSDPYERLSIIVSMAIAEGLKRTQLKFSGLVDEFDKMQENADLLEMFCEEYIRHPDRIDQKIRTAETSDDVKELLIKYRQTWRKKGIS